MFDTDIHKLILSVSIIISPISIYYLMYNIDVIYKGILKIYNLWFDIFDIWTEGRYNKNKAIYNHVILSIMENLDEWLIKKDYARFPKTGSMSKICIMKDEKGQLVIATENINDGKEEAITGFYKSLLLEEIDYAYRKESLDKILAHIKPNSERLLEDHNA